MMDWGYMSAYMGAGFGRMTVVGLLSLLVLVGAILVVADLLGRSRGN